MKRLLNSTANRNAKVRKIWCPFSNTKYLCELKFMEGEGDYELSYWSVKKYHGRPDSNKKVKLTYEMQIEEYSYAPTDAQLLLRIIHGYQCKNDIMSNLKRSYERLISPEPQDKKLTEIEEFEIATALPGELIND